MLNRETGYKVKKEKDLAKKERSRYLPVLALRIISCPVESCMLF
jgi:hypothetical protein